MSNNINDLVSQFVALRDKKSELMAGAKDLAARLDDRMGELTSKILKAMDEQGMESVRTEAGTAYKSTKRSVSVGGWDEFLPWLRATENWHMLNRAANKTAVLEYLEEHEELPPGINSYSELTIGVNRPTKRSKAA
jgi:hypothetical protein